MSRHPPTRGDYDAAEPFEKGFMAYSFSAWPGSEIPSEANCPFKPGTKNEQQFNDGVNAAVLCAQDSEE
jgi:hypothetical protein